MQDTRLKKLANELVNYSVQLKAGEHLQINCPPEAIPLAKELIRSAYAIGAYPHVKLTSPKLTKEIMMGLQPQQAEAMVRYDDAITNEMDAVIHVGAALNPYEDAAVANEKREVMYAARREQQKIKPKKEITRWCVCIYPTEYYAASAGMSLDDFEDYYFSVCCMDYQKFGDAMEKLRKILEDADRVRIEGPGTDLTFSIKGINKKVSAGDRNIPDGEVYTAPVRESINGRVSFNVPSFFGGTRFENISLVFRDGKAVEAHSTQEKLLNEVLDCDEGARYTGEFAFGLNPQLNVPIGLTLFDEKIDGSFHIAMGNGLDVVDNGNRSSIHWDLVCIQTPEMGGGCIYIDDVLIRKDGRFVLPELEALNNGAKTEAHNPQE